MKARLLLASVLLTVSAFAQHFSNASVTNVDARGGVASAIGRGTGWYAWTVPMSDDVQICCNACTLESKQNGWTINDRQEIGGGGSMVVAVRVNAGEIEKVQMLSDDCTINGRGYDIRVLQNVDPASSVAFLATGEGHHVLAAIAHHNHPSAMNTMERLAGRENPHKIREDALFWIGQRGGDRGFRYLQNFMRGEESSSLRKKAVFSLSQSQSDGAIPELVNLARHDKSREIRREAIFWLGQRAGRKAEEELRRAVDEDPDDDVREHAVFAISQLPKDRAVPILIDLVRNHKSAAVRKKAMFWLTQTGDDRAIDVIEEILMK
jgi:HEAT repeat protein